MSVQSTHVIPLGSEQTSEKAGDRILALVAMFRDDLVTHLVDLQLRPSLDDMKILLEDFAQRLAFSDPENTLHVSVANLINFRKSSISQAIVSTALAQQDVASTGFPRDVVPEYEASDTKLRSETYHAAPFPTQMTNADEIFSTKNQSEDGFQILSESTWTSDDVEKLSQSGELLPAGRVTESQRQGVSASQSSTEQTATTPDCDPLLQTAAHKWLRQVFQSISTLSGTENKPQIKRPHVGSHQPLRAYDSSTIRNNVGFEARFKLDMSHGLALKEISTTTWDSVVTVTGSQSEAQAMTCLEYTKQTWPGNGLKLWDILKKALVDSETEFSGVCEDRASFAACFHPPYLLITAQGTRSHHEDTLDQLSWVLGALSSPFSFLQDGKLVYCTTKFRINDHSAEKEIHIQSANYLNETLDRPTEKLPVNILSSLTGHVSEISKVASSAQSVKSSLTRSSASSTLGSLEASDFSSILGLSTAPTEAIPRSLTVGSMSTLADLNYRTFTSKQVYEVPRAYDLALSMYEQASLTPTSLFDIDEDTVVKGPTASDGSTFVHESQSCPFPKLPETADLLYVEFGVEVEYNNIEPSSGPGTCWLKLFDECVVIHGFPTKRRPQVDLGLELSLGLAAKLMDVNRVLQFEENLYLKQFNASLVARELIDDILIWHLHRSHSEEYQPLRSPLVSAGHLADYDKIISVRHIIGFCAAIRHFGGHPEADYSTTSPRTLKSSPLFALGQCLLSTGRIIRDKLDYQFSTNHKRALSASKTYLQRFRFLEQRPILFWDTKTEQAWLMNGLRAMLHLLRQSWSIDEKEDWGTLYCLKREHLQESENLCAAAAAHEFFRNEQNLSARISISNITAAGKEYELVSERLDLLFSLIEQAFSHQRKFRDWSQVSRSSLEGWDITKLAARDEVINPSIIALNTASKSWVDLVRHIGAVALLGHGFGELIQPGKSSCCAMSPQEGHLTVAMSDLTRIIGSEHHGLSAKSDFSLNCSHITWYSPMDPKKLCYCHKDNLKRYVPCVQMIWPTSHVPSLPEEDEDFTLSHHADGAITFGHHDSVEYHIPDFGTSPVSNSSQNPVLAVEYPDGEMALPDEHVSMYYNASATQSYSASSPQYSGVKTSLRNNQGHMYGSANINDGCAILGDFSGHFTQHIHNHVQAGNEAPILTSTSEESYSHDQHSPWESIKTVTSENTSGQASPPVELSSIPIMSMIPHEKHRDSGTSQVTTTTGNITDRDHSLAIVTNVTTPELELTPPAIDKRHNGSISNEVEADENRGTPAKWTLLMAGALFVGIISRAKELTL